MPFPKLQKMPLACASGPTKTLVKEFDDDGNSSLVLKDIHEELPPVENFDLTNLIRNKIPLQEVSSKVLGGNKLTIHVKPAEEKPAEEKPAKEKLAED